MLCPPIGLVLIRRLGLHQSEVVSGLLGLFLIPLSGIIFIGAHTLLFMSVMQVN
jgi:hypothetical protein